jgi:hypothetical protein
VGLHQGSPLSPLLCNLYLDRFDRAMLAAGQRIIRYGDDFAAPAATRADAERALVVAATELEDLRLELNTGKTHAVSFDEGVTFLGETTTAAAVTSPPRSSPANWPTCGSRCCARPGAATTPTPTPPPS